MNRHQAMVALARRLGRPFFPSILFRFLHNFSPYNSSPIAECSYKRPDCGVRPLIINDIDENLEQKENNPYDKASMYGIVFDWGQGMFNGQHDKSQGHGNYLHQRNLDDNSDERCCTSWGLHSSRVTQSPTDKVKEVFAVKQPPESCPDGIDAGGDRDEARISMPHQIAHDALNTSKTLRTSVLVEQKLELGACSEGCCD